MRSVYAALARIMLLLFPVFCNTSPVEEQYHPPLLLVCLHGVGADRLADIPSVARVASEFVHVDHVKPVFLTDSVPNQVSLSTGYTTEEHGFVSDHMLDPVWKERFDSMHIDEKWFTSAGAKPLWVHLAQAGHSSVVYDFVGGATAFSEVPEGAVHFESLSHSTSVANRAEKIAHSVLGGARFVCVLVQQPGAAVQKYGLSSSESAAAFHDTDTLIASVMAKLEGHQVNMIITGDHGMAAVPSENVIFLEDFVDLSDFELYEDLPHPTLGLWPKEGKEATVFLNLTDTHPKMDVFLKEDIPKHLHYRHHRRIAPILLQAAEGWVIAESRKPHTTRHASSGYDNLLTSMQTFMVASGPGFARNRTISTLDITDIFHLASHLTGVKELQTNRSQTVGNIFKFEPCSVKVHSQEKALCSDNDLDLETKENSHQSKIGGFQAFFLVVTIGLGVIALTLFYQRYKRSLPAHHGYSRMERNLEPDLSLRSEPLLDSEYRDDSVQLDDLSGLRSKMTEEEEDDLPPGTFTI